MTRNLVGGLALAVIASGLGFWREPEVRQPIEFPHKTHVALNLQCTSCHERAEKDTSAGRPPTALCLSCHAGGDGAGEIKKVQAFEQGGEIPWRRVWRLPPHVLFSHRVHVAVVALTCQTCHGPMETLDRPPSRPLRVLTMNDCIGCHEKSERRSGKAPAREVTATRAAVSTDCITCHR